MGLWKPLGGDAEAVLVDPFVAEVGHVVASGPKTREALAVERGVFESLFEHACSREPACLAFHFRELFFHVVVGVEVEAEEVADRRAEVEVFERLGSIVSGVAWCGDVASR